MTRAYLAGPDVFLPDAAAHYARKVAICAAHGIEGVAPLADGLAAWDAIFAHCLATMERCDVAIANLTPFRGASADSGTLVELGWFLGRGRPVFGYSNTAEPFDRRSERQRACVPDPLDGIAVEPFGLADNLMIDGAVARAGGLPVLTPPDGATLPFDDLAVFDALVRRAAARLRDPARLRVPGARPAPG